MSVPASARSGTRFFAALTGTAFALAALVITPGAAAAHPSAQHSALPRATNSAALSASVTAAGGGVLGAGQDLVVTVSVANPTDSPIVSGTVSLWLDPNAQSSRSALTSWLASTESDESHVVLGGAPLPTLEPGSSTATTITVPAAALPFMTGTKSAVYGIGATVSGGQGAGARSSVAWAPGDASTRTNVAVVMPIVSPATGNGLISSEDLSTYTSPSGVLTRDLDGVTGHSTIALGIDPMIIASIRALGNAAPTSATDWLNRLSALPNDTFSLGYGDADLAGQIQAGLTTPLTPIALGYALDPKNFSPAPAAIGEPSNVTAARTTPSPSPTPGEGPALPTLDDLVAWKYTIPGIGWPGDATLSTADVAPLANAGYNTLIVSGSNTNAAELDATPNSALRTDSGTLTVTDQGLSDALRQAVTAPSDLAWNMAMSQVNAQLELLSAEGTTARHVLVALDRSWPSSGTQLQRTLDALFATPWSTPATYSAVAAGSPSSGVALVDAPESDTRLDAIRSLLDDERKLTDFSSILFDPTTLTGRTRSELLTLLAVSWQNPRTDWTTAVTKNRDAATKTLHSVRLLPTETINLVSAQGSIPFTVSNELSGEVATVVLNASPSNSRLEIDSPTTKSIPRDSRATMLVPVKAKVGNGQVLLSLQLYSPTGVPIGDPSAVTVDVHADWEGIGAVILLVLLVLLFGFGVVRGILRRRAQRRLEGEEPPSNASLTDDTSSVNGERSANEHSPGPPTSEH